MILRVERPELVRQARDTPRTRSHHILDHPDEPHLPPVFRRVDLLDAVGLERFDLVRRDGAAAADDHADVIRPLARGACRPCTRSTRCARPGMS